jgi:hypothetical protein
MKEETLIKYVKKLLSCDCVRVVKFDHTKLMFLVIGFNERSEGQWFNQDGEAQNFDYLEEKVIANGFTLKSLLVQARKYKKLLNVSPTPFFGKKR